MLPLMLTAWIINRRLLFQFSPGLAFYLFMLVLAQREGDPIKVALILVFFATLMTILITLQGLLLPVEEFILSLPVSRSQVVCTKYLTSFLGLAVGLVLPLLTLWIAHGMLPKQVPALSGEILGMGGLAAIFLAFGIGLFLPFVYQFGPAKGFSFFSLSLVASIVACVSWKGREACTVTMIDFFHQIMESRSFALFVIAFLMLFGLVSLFFSIWTYRQKVAKGEGRRSSVRGMIARLLSHWSRMTA